MYDTLFTIKSHIAGIPVFGFGWLLGIWAVLSAILIVWTLARQGWTAELQATLPALAISGGAIAFLLPNLVDSGGLPIRGYGVMLLCAMGAGVTLSVYRARQKGLDPEIILSLATWLFITGIVGARAFYVIKNWPDFLRPNSENPALIPTLIGILDVTKGGLVVYGGMLAGGLTLAAFVKKYRLAGLALSDLIVPGVVLGMAIGRIGCFLHGCCYGGVCGLPWAVEFPYNSPPHLQQVQQGQLPLHGIVLRDTGSAPAIVRRVEAGSTAAAAGIKPGDHIVEVQGYPVATADGTIRRLLDVPAESGEVSVRLAGEQVARRWSTAGSERSLPVHPSQIYSAVDALLLCLFLLAYEPYKRREGELTALLLTIHPISRFLIEMIRVDEAAVLGTGFSIAQIVSIVILVGAAGLWLYLLKSPSRPLAPRLA